MEINDLIKALREKKSRDNRELLDEAADALAWLNLQNQVFLGVAAKFREAAVRKPILYEGPWTSTAVENPKKTDEYIVVIEGFPVATALYYDAAMRVWMDRLDEEPSYYRVSYWMEMPKVPGKVQNAECRVQSEEVEE